MWTGALGFQILKAARAQEIAGVFSVLTDGRLAAKILGAECSMSGLFI